MLPDFIYEGLASAMRLLPPETAHDLSMQAMASPQFARLPIPPLAVDHNLAVSHPALGELRHPIGLAAGFDKNALALPAFQRMHFAALETGTITPKPQPGNPKPRLFRYPDSRSIINRMGFNSDGHAAVRQRIADTDIGDMVLGINLGKNKATPNADALTEYLAGFATFADFADYFVVNISSPNTAGLRELASPAFIGDLADGLTEAERGKTFVKLDPDMDKALFQELIAALAERKFGGVILCNTHRVTWPEAGGQSGQPLTSQSQTFLEWAYEVHKGALPMIASGGVFSGLDVYQRLSRGAFMVQIYTAFIYRGPLTVQKILTELDEELRLRGISKLSDVIGSFYR